jgi:hypothetical protein
MPQFRRHWWMAVYALQRIVEQFGNPDDISRQAITTAFENASDVDFLGLIPSWTPRGGTGEGIFGRVANPYRYSITFDADAGEFVIADEQMNLVEEVAGRTEYAQPAG